MGLFCVVVGGGISVVLATGISVWVRIGFGCGIPFRASEWFVFFSGKMFGIGF